MRAARGRWTGAFPAEYLSATLRLRSGVELHLTEGARLAGVKDLEAYGGFQSEQDVPKLPHSRWHRGLIVGENLHGIAITGPGVIDGNKVFDPQGEEKCAGRIPCCWAIAGAFAARRDDPRLGQLRVLFSTARTCGWRVRPSRVAGTASTLRFAGGLEPRRAGGRLPLLHRRRQHCRRLVEDIVVENCEINSSCNGVRLIGPRGLSLSKCDFYGPGKFEHRTSNRTNMLAGLCLQPSAWASSRGR